MTTFTLPWPPSVNDYWTPVVRTKRVRGKVIHYPASILTAKARLYRCKVKVVVGLFPNKMTGPLSVDVRWIPPTARKFDIDNFFKAPFDALTHAGVWGDDSQIEQLTAVKCPKIKGGAVEITIKELGI